MQKVKLATLLAILCVARAFAADCKKVEWPYKVEQRNREIHAILKLNAFDKNMSYLIFETSKKEQSQLEKLLFKYLIFNSKDKEIESFFKAMEWFRLGKKNKSRPINESYFCSLYKKTLSLPLAN